MKRAQKRQTLVEQIARAKGTVSALHTAETGKALPAVQQLTRTVMLWERARRIKPTPAVFYGEQTERLERRLGELLVKAVKAGDAATLVQAAKAVREFRRPHPAAHDRLARILSVKSLLGPDDRVELAGLEWFLKASGDTVGNRELRRLCKRVGFPIARAKAGRKIGTRNLIQ